MRKLMWALGVIVFAACSANTSDGDVPLPDGVADAKPAALCNIDLESELPRLGVPGLSAGVVKNGRLVCTKTAGLAHIAEQRAVTRDTVFAWDSISKTVTATAALILYDEGRFRLNDDINGHLPFPVRNPHCPDTPITFRHLLTHTSSIIDNEPVYDATYTIGDSPILLGDFVRGYTQAGGQYYSKGKNFDTDCPGEYAEYSNVAVGLLGYLIEQISGMTLDGFCRERIFDPLGMTQTSFRLARLDVGNVAMPYEEGSREDGSAFVETGHVGFATFPDGSLRSSVPSMARFLVMSAGLGAYEGRRILKESTALETRRVQFPELDSQQGLIWFYDFDGTRIGHDGEDSGSSSMMFFDPKDGTGVLIVANGNWYAKEDAPEAHALMDKLFAEAANQANSHNIREKSVRVPDTPSVLGVLVRAPVISTSRHR